MGPHQKLFENPCLTVKRFRTCSPTSLLLLPTLRGPLEKGSLTFVPPGEDVGGQPPERVLQVPGGLHEAGRAGGRGRRSGRGRGRRGRPAARHGAQLQLDEHHVVAEPHAQVQRRLTAQELVHLGVVQGLEGLHYADLGALCLWGESGGIISGGSGENTSVGLVR